MSRTSGRPGSSPFLPVLEPVEDRITPSSASVVSAVHHTASAPHASAPHAKLAQVVTILLQVHANLTAQTTASDQSASDQSSPPASADPGPSYVPITSPQDNSAAAATASREPSTEYALDRKNTDGAVLLFGGDSSGPENGPVVLPREARADGIGDGDHPVIDDSHMLTARGHLTHNAPNIRHVHPDGPGGMEHLVAEKPLLTEAEINAERPTVIATENTLATPSTALAPAELPAPEAAGLLASISPFDPELVGAAVDRFLDRLETVRGEVSDWLAHSEQVAPWMLTVACLLAAGEMTRRQVHHSTADSSLMGETTAAMGR